MKCAAYLVLLISWSLTVCRDLIGMKQRGDKQSSGTDLQANAIVQAYCSALDVYINAQVVGTTQHGTCVVTLLGVTETLEVEVRFEDATALFLRMMVYLRNVLLRFYDTLLQVQSLRPGIPADPATLPPGSRCDAM